MTNETLIFFYRAAHRCGYEPGLETPPWLVPRMGCGMAGHARFGRIFGVRYRHYARETYRAEIFWEQAHKAFAVAQSYRAQITQITHLVGGGR